MVILPEHKCLSWPYWSSRLEALNWGGEAPQSVPGLSGWIASMAEKTLLIWPLVAWGVKHTIIKMSRNCFQPNTNWKTKRNSWDCYIPISYRTQHVRAKAAHHPVGNKCVAFYVIIHKVCIFKSTYIHTNILLVKGIVGPLISIFCISNNLAVQKDVFILKSISFLIKPKLSFILILHLNEYFISDFLLIGWWMKVVSTMQDCNSMYNCAYCTIPSTSLLLFWRYYLFCGWWGIQSLLSWNGSLCAANQMISTVKWKTLNLS